jgi:hypothetical protein
MHIKRNDTKKKQIMRFKGGKDERVAGTKTMSDGNTTWEAQTVDGPYELATLEINAANGTWNLDEFRGREFASGQCEECKSISTSGTFTKSDGAYHFLVEVFDEGGRALDDPAPTGMTITREASAVEAGGPIASFFLLPHVTLTGAP